jgi:hypothetical protein
MAWTNLAAAFAYGSKLTSAQMQNLRDNITALANGDAGAPLIQNSALDSGISASKLSTVVGSTRWHNETGEQWYEVLGSDGTWYQCTLNTYSGGTCFPAGSLVLMSDMTYRLIETVKKGDLIFSSHGIVPVESLYTTKLGSRKMYRMTDGSLLWSAEHSFWVKRGEREYLWSMDVSLLENEQRTGLIGGLKDFSQMFEGENLKSERFACLDRITKHSWKENTPEHLPEYKDKPDTPLYLPLTENGELIIVNGYLVGAAINEFATDYSKLKWE